MKNFNIKRFTKVLIRLFLNKKRSSRSLLLGLIIFFSLSAIFFCDPFSLEPIDKVFLESKLSQSLYLSVFGAVTIIYIYGAYIISDLHTKQNLLNELSLPATNLEKFIARYLYSTVSIIMIIIIALFISDIFQMFFNMVIHKGSYASITKLIFKSLTRIDSNLLETFFQKTLFSGLMLHSLYILGGMLFKKVAWLQTSITIGILSIIFCIIFIGFSYLIYRYTDYVVIVLYDKQTLLKIINILFTCLFYYLAYKIYCRLQVINNKWLNI